MVPLPAGRNNASASHHGYDPGVVKRGTARSIWELPSTGVFPLTRISSPCPTSAQTLKTASIIRCASCVMPCRTDPSRAYLKAVISGPDKVTRNRSKLCFATTVFDTSQQQTSLRCPDSCSQTYRRQNAGAVLLQWTALAAGAQGGKTRALS